MNDFLRADIAVQEERHLIFSTNRQLAQLSGSREWFVDGTFKVVKRPFYQLFSIHAFVQSGGHMKMVPLVFVLMSRRRRIDYVKVFRELKKLTRRLQVNTIVGDIEAAVWSAIGKVFPSVKVRGCLFHLAQAIGKKCLDLGLGVNIY